MRWRTHTLYLWHVSISEQFWADKVAKILSIKKIGKKAHHHTGLEISWMICLSLWSAGRDLALLWKTMLFTDCNLRDKQSTVILQLRIKIQKAWVSLCSVWLIQWPGLILEHFNVSLFNFSWNCCLGTLFFPSTKAYKRKKAETKKQSHSNESVKPHWWNFQKQQAVKDLDNWNRYERKARAWGRKTS